LPPDLYALFWKAEGENIVKYRIKHNTSKIALAIILAGLTAGLPLRRLNTGASASAHTAKRPSDAPPALRGEQAIRSLKEQGLYDSLQEAVAAARYELRWADRPALGGLPPAYHAPNPAQRLNAYFASTGLHLAPHRMSSAVSDQAEWQATMRLIGYGYGESLLPVGFADLEAQGNRIEYRRAWPPITEWYINKAEGLEQGFTIDTQPGVRPERERLRLALELTGDLSAELAEEGRVIALKQADGELALHYSDLHAYDAQGQELPSQMRVSEGQVILEVDDEKAVYPVTIDPTVNLKVKLLASDGAADDYFGDSVAIFGDTVVVGAPGDDVGANQNQGSAYVFVRSGFTTWSQQAKLTAWDGATGDYFGHSVAISADTVVVGTPFDDVNYSRQGSADVFVRRGTTWSRRQKLIASDGAADDNFGYSVAISGDTIVVGAPYDDSFAKPNRGSVYVFTPSNGYWNPQQKLIASDGAAGDHFGYSIAISGDKFVVGAHRDDIGTNSDQGSAYVFVRIGAGWIPQQKLTASDGAAGDHFGASIAISKDTVVVTAYGDDIDANQDQGSAYVFVHSGSTWSEQQKLTASDGAAGDSFGVSVAISGGMVVVGAHSDDTGSNANQGSVYPILIISN
jgi:hypothetical protein